MRISISERPLLAKPQTRDEKQKYFLGLRFKTGKFPISEFKKIIEGGYTLSYLFKDNDFMREEDYMKSNYRGTQFIVVDIDRSPIPPSEFVEKIKYAPTIWHTTFSNLTEAKDNLYCFHLIYCFEDIIEGESSFSKVFDEITSDYYDAVDSQAKDAHRVIYTSNSSLPNYEANYDGKVYNVSDFLDNTFDCIDGFFSDNTVAKNDSIKNKNTSSLNLLVGDKNATGLELESSFLNDLYGMPRGAFVEAYKNQYEYRESTQVANTDCGYVYLRGTEYYELPKRYWYDKSEQKMLQIKVPIGERTNCLVYDCCCISKINGEITKEWLVYSLITDVYKNYDNSDKELTNEKILNICEYVWNNKDTIVIPPKNRWFKINMGYFAKQNLTKNQIIGKVKKLVKDSEIGEYIDLSESFEQNMKTLREAGFPVKKQRLKEFCSRHNIVLRTDKEIRNEAVRMAAKEHPDYSLNQLVVVLRDRGVNVGRDTINRVLGKNKSKDKAIGSCDAANNG